MLYLDLDGVFADMVSAATKYTNISNYERDPATVWKALRQVPNFFLHLPLMPGALHLFNWLTSKFDHCEVLTALPRAEGCLVTAQRDKVDWTHRYLSPTIQVNCVSSKKLKKHFCKDRHDILIDDHPRNISDWIESGGVGILHTSPEQTIELVKKYCNK